MLAGPYEVPARRWMRSLMMGVLGCAAMLLAVLVWTATASRAATPSVAGSFSVTSVTTTSAGTVQTVKVTALNRAGKPNPGYRGTVLVTSTDAQASLPAAYTFTSADKGAHSFSVTLKTAGTQTVTATDSRTVAMTGSQTVTVTPGSAVALMVSGLGDGVAGAAQSITLTARDAFANVATGYRGTVHVTSSDPQAVLPVDFGFTAADAGSRALVVKLRTAGAQTVTFTDTSDATLSVTTPSVTVTNGPATALRLGTDLTQSYGQNRLTTAGQHFMVTITAVDAYGNTAADYVGTVRLTSSDGGTPLNRAFGETTVSFGASDAGTVTLSGVAFFTKEIYGDAASLTAVDTADTRITAGATFTVLPGPAVRYAACAPALTKASGYQNQSGPIGVNEDLGLPFTALDAYGNDATNREPANPLVPPLPRGYEAQATVTTTDAQAANIVGATFTGSRLWVGPPVDITLRTAGVQTMTITDPGHQDPSGHDLTITCSYTVRGPQALSATIDIADPQTSGNTVNLLPASSFVPPNDQNVTVEGLTGPYVGDALTGYNLLGAITSIAGSPTAGIPLIRWDLDPAVIPNGMITCDASHTCAVPGPKQITYRLRDAFGNTSVGVITLSPWNVSLGHPVGNIVYNGASMQVTPSQALTLGSQYDATVVSAADGKVTVRTNGGVAMTMLNPVGSGLATGMGVTVRVDQPINVGGQEALGGCIPSGGLYCPEPSFAAVTVIPTVDPNNLKILATEGYDACVLPELGTQCPSLTFMGTGTDILTNALPDATVGAPYSYAFDVVESPAGETISFTISGLFPLPPGLSLSSTGVLQGTPTTPGTYVFFVEARGMTSNSTANARVVLTVK